MSINDSSDITADRLLVAGRTADGFDLTGTTSDVTISRSRIGLPDGSNAMPGADNDVWIGPGVTHTRSPRT